MWKDFFFRNIDELVSWIRKQPNRSDLYICYTKLDEPRRLKENVSGSKFLYSDMDTCDPRKLPQDLQPTVTWETSPGRFHGLWELDKTLYGSELEDLNRALTRRLEPLGADKGGWDLTQVLRIPGTHNNKYPESPRVKLIWNKGLELSSSGLAASLIPRNEKPNGVNSTGDSDFLATLTKHRSQITTEVMAKILASVADEGKRSDTLWWLTHKLAEGGIPAEDIKTLIQGTVWNKYAGRADEDKRLNHDVLSALDKTLSPQPTADKLPLSTPAAGTPASLFLPKVVSDDVLMAQRIPTNRWSVEDIWGRRSHGIVGGEPKSFKSWLVQDLAISIASGTDFLNQYEVKDIGPVLYIQNENADWIMKDRAVRIRESKGLVGRVHTSTGTSRVGRSNRLSVEFARSLPLHYINNSGLNLLHPEHQQFLLEAIHDIRPHLIVLDPLYLMFAGDVSSARDLNPLLSWLIGIKNHYSTGILLIHHMNKFDASKSSGARGGQRLLGSTTLHGWIESAWYVGQGELPSRYENREEEICHRLIIEREFRGAPGLDKLHMVYRMGRRSNLYAADFLSTEEVAEMDASDEKPAPTRKKSESGLREVVAISPNAEPPEPTRRGKPYERFKKSNRTVPYTEEEMICNRYWEDFRKNVKDLGRPFTPETRAQFANRRILEGVADDYPIMNKMYNFLLESLGHNQLGPLARNLNVSKGYLKAPIQRLSALGKVKYDDVLGVSII